MTRSKTPESTRQRILETAERLFAEHGVFSVSNRQISDEAGLGNNTAVSYHFGSKAELVRAIYLRHNESLDRLRAKALEQYAGSVQLRDWLTCVVRPFTDHLVSLASNSWYARFAAQLMTEPKLRELGLVDVGQTELQRTIIDAVHGCLPDLAPAVRAERDEMARVLIVHMCARREPGLPDDSTEIWNSTATGLINALTGLYQAPASH
ncbi:AcrR family transcriptional regulator [Kibdelosporangium banguiense]|uniref:AcrR family transcriptional regulator n=1 Tax=Kibdelosporangium banguiense TaxID=1365924 RepID=A0ABS4TUV5_9PSEU|nr:TetR/AcrR family transcriptional regulator [Kibdelosporangium banguiense]MBP2328180.1 AcrR family transcriptional regulator [Kibdelosporangium banguiense]